MELLLIFKLLVDKLLVNKLLLHIVFPLIYIFDNNVTWFNIELLFSKLFFRWDLIVKKKEFV